MKNKLKSIALSYLLALSPALAKSGDYKIPYLFNHPRDGKFKVIPWYQDKWDNTSQIHFLGCSGLAGNLNYYFDQKNSKNQVLKSTLITFGLGLLKETEDGFREGFGRKNLIADILGTTSGILIYQSGKWLIKKL